MIAVVGAGAAGVAAAEALRARGYAGGLRVLSAEGVQPYERPALSKSYLVSPAPVSVPALRPNGALARAGISVELNTEVVDVHPREQLLVTRTGEEIEYEMLVLATGAESRRLNLPGAGLRGIYYLRELRDAKALREVLVPGKRVVVVGGGVIGLEIAASATRLGVRVRVIELMSQVMARVVPEGPARVLEGLHKGRGVTISLATRVVGLEGERGRIRGLVLDDGEFVPADAIVVGIGAVPRTVLAARAGLAVGDGILVDGFLRSSDEHIFAAGDVACVYHGGSGRHIRLEQWHPSEAQGRLVAASIQRRALPYDEVPWMWSDQHEWHLQATGLGFADCEVVVRGQIEDRGGISWFGLREGQLVAACGVSVGTGVARTMRVARALIARRDAVDPDELADPRTDLRRLAVDRVDA